MTGLELSKMYFNEFGKNMLENDFKDIIEYLCVGFVGSGSERYLLDDELSKDHDFEPGFAIFIPDVDIISEKDEFRLMKAYNSLPKEFMGYKRSIMSPVGGNRNGVIRIKDFYLNHVGISSNIIPFDFWLNVKMEDLYEATDGEIFFDNYKEFTSIRVALLNMPNDIKYKRIASNLLIMSKTGEYNYNRCLKHNELSSAQLSLFHFVDATINVYSLLKGVYLPYYKWTFKALRKIDDSFSLEEKLSYLILNNNDNECSIKKVRIIEDISKYIVKMLNDLGLSSSNDLYLEPHAYIVNDLIKNNILRNLNI